MPTSGWGMSVFGISSEPDSHSPRQPQHVNRPPLSLYPFGAPPPSPPSIRDVEWTVNEGEAWDVVSSLRGRAGKKAHFQVCRPLSSSFPFWLETDQPNEPTDGPGRQPYTTPPPFSGLYSILSGLDPFDGCRLGFVAFRNAGTGGQEVLFMVIWRVMGLLRKMMDRL